MKKIILFLLLLFNSQISSSQALPVNRYEVRKLLLDLHPTNPSFAYSLRKIKSGYIGFAVKIRRSNDDAEANVAFDANAKVSNTSNVIVTALGSSSLTIGQELSYATFLGANTAFVTTWYDQGTNAYHATQTSNPAQPTLVLNSAGPLNTLPSILFNGATLPSKHLNVGQPIENLTNSGINGTFLLGCKVTANAMQISFGMQTAGDWRWGMHLNWSDGNCYFDAGGVCCTGSRNFNNNANLNLFKQYSFVRGTTFKTVRINGGTTALNNSSAGTNTPMTGGGFFIGAWAFNYVNNGFYGNVTETIMFPTDLTNAQLAPLETNQISFWQ